MSREEIIFANNIRNVRLSRGMKMTQLAKRAGLSLSAMSKVEKGVRRLKQTQMLQLCGILDCKLSDMFIKADDKLAAQWQAEMQKRLQDNEASGLKIFGAGLRVLRNKVGKTIAQAAKDAKMTLSVYHKIEVGQREVYENEIENLAKTVGKTVDGLFKEIVTLHNSGQLTQHISKIEEKVRTALTPGKVISGKDVSAPMFGAKIYDSVRRKLTPVYGIPKGKGIEFVKSDEKMMLAPIKLEKGENFYIIYPNAARMGPMFPQNSFMMVQLNVVPKVGDLAILFDEEFDKIAPNTAATARVVMLREDAKGNMFGAMANPEEKIAIKNPTGRLHKVVHIIAE